MSYNQWQNPMEMQQQNTQRNVDLQRNGFVSLSQSDWDKVFLILVDTGFLKLNKKESFDRAVLNDQAGVVSPFEMRFSGAKLWNYEGRVYVGDNVAVGSVPSDLQQRIDTANQQLSIILGAQGGLSTR